MAGESRSSNVGLLAVPCHLSAVPSFHTLPEVRTATNRKAYGGIGPCGSFSRVLRQMVMAVFGLWSLCKGLWCRAGLNLSRMHSPGSARLTTGSQAGQVLPHQLDQFVKSFMCTVMAAHDLATIAGVISREYLNKGTLVQRILASLRG